MYSRLVNMHFDSFILMLMKISVPLASLLNATKPPASKGKKDLILSPEGHKRFFVTHGGLFSKDEVTLDDIRKINRIGRQPGHEGIMSRSSFHYLVSTVSDFMMQARFVLQLFIISSIFSSFLAPMDRSSSNAGTRSEQKGMFTKLDQYAAS
jgi:hypothetical protein